VERPFFSRRQFFELLGAGVSTAVLAGRPALGQVIKEQPADLLNTAKNVVFILLAGAPSHVDTFDFKRTRSTPLDVMKPDTINGIDFPVGIMPNLANQLGDIAIVRSVKSWALQHNLAQTWSQIGRSPAAVLGDIAPNIGSIVAVEKEGERQAGQVFPTFLALNSGSAIGSGYMSAAFAPLKIVPATSGLPDTINPDGETRFNNKFNLLKNLDGTLRQKDTNPYGRKMADYDEFYDSGRSMMFNAMVNQAFRYTAEEAARYGSTGFGNACLLAHKVLAARGGTRYIQITLGGWDHHQDIYARLPPLAKQFDNGLAALLNDMKSAGTLQETLVVVSGEFGRTTGAITGQNGRDHYSQQFVLFAGAGVRGGRTIGSTDADGANTAETGWSRDRDIRPEDVEATIYSAMGINYTRIRYDDPFGRGFYYVPDSDRDLYGPIQELWS
jgi:hypothetical protein